MSKITPEHLARQAVVYIRQSTVDQVANNLESKRRQYGLVDRSRQLGWSDVAIIDDDLGRSGGGIARPGFEKLLAAICEGRVGAVVSIEASRLARNGRDWHTLLEFCGLVGTLILDEDGVYDPRHPNDRPLLGMKGTMSEMELSVLRQRSLEALKQKARRGELFMTVAVGYVRVGHNRVEKDPDRRIQEAIVLDFLGYCFRPRLVRKSRDNTLFCGFNPAVSPSALKSMRAKIRELGVRRRAELSLAEIAYRLNPLLRGWINYYGRYAPSALAPLLRYVNQTLRAWALRKFKRFRAHKVHASQLRRAVPT